MPFIEIFMDGEPSVFEKACTGKAKTISTNANDKSFRKYGIRQHFRYNFIKFVGSMILFKSKKIFCG